MPQFVVPITQCFLQIFNLTGLVEQEVLGAWRTEVDKKPATMSVDDAYRVSRDKGSNLHSEMYNKQRLIDFFY